MLIVKTFKRNTHSKLFSRQKIPSQDLLLDFNLPLGVCPDPMSAGNLFKYKIK